MVGWQCYSTVFPIFKVVNNDTIKIKRNYCLNGLCHVKKYNMRIRTRIATAVYPWSRHQFRRVNKIIIKIFKNFWKTVNNKIMTQNYQDTVVNINH